MYSQTMSFSSYFPVLGSSLSQYLKSIAGIPILSAKQEHDLAVECFEHNDLQAARELIISHLRFVAYVARGYQGYGLAQEDLIQEGNIGLMKAVKRFNPSMGVRLISFAIYWIKAEIHKYILKNWRIVKSVTTKEQRKLFFQLKRNKKTINRLTYQEAQQIAKNLQISVDAVIDMDNKFSSPEASLEAPLSSKTGDTHEETTLGQILPAMIETPADLHEKNTLEDNRKKALTEAILSLNSRSQNIVTRRWLQTPKSTLQELANEHSVSIERIRQIENQALDKIKQQLQLKIGHQSF